MRKISSIFISFIFMANSIMPSMAMPEAFGTGLILPDPGTMVSVSPSFTPALIKGLTVHQDNPFLFDFIVDPGQDYRGVIARSEATKVLIPDTRSYSQSFKDQADRMIKYFFAALTIPDNDIWVNLSPYEKNRMVPSSLGQTAMGRDLLAQDYLLKQLTASLIDPQKELGKTFWNTVYAKAKAMYGTTQVPVNTFNKVWIVPQRAGVYEHGQTAFIVSGHLKVMLEEDYLSLKKHIRISSVIASEAKQSFSTHSLSSQIIRTLVLPEIEKEINEGKNFATLRQIFYAQVLAVWFKRNLKQALLNRVYANKSTVKGIDDNTTAVNEAIYQQYLKAYKKGVFNFIKEEPLMSFPNASIGNPEHATVARKYFSGGFADLAQLSIARVADLSVAEMAQAAKDFDVKVATVRPQYVQPNSDAAMMSVEELKSWVRATINKMTEGRLRHIKWSDSRHITIILLEYEDPYRELSAKLVSILLSGMDFTNATRGRTQWSSQAGDGHYAIIDEGIREIVFTGLLKIQRNGIEIEKIAEALREDAAMAARQVSHEAVRFAGKSQELLQDLGDGNVIARSRERVAVLKSMYGDMVYSLNGYPKTKKIIFHTRETREDHELILPLFLSYIRGLFGSNAGIEDNYISLNVTPETGANVETIVKNLELKMNEAVSEALHLGKLPDVMGAPLGIKPAVQSIFWGRYEAKIHVDDYSGSFALDMYRDEVSSDAGDDASVYVNENPVKIGFPEIVTVSLTDSKKNVRDVHIGVYVTPTRLVKFRYEDSSGQVARIEFKLDGRPSFDRPRIRIDEAMMTVDKNRPTQDAAMANKRSSKERPKYIWRDEVERVMKRDGHAGNSILGIKFYAPDDSTAKMILNSFRIGQSNKNSNGNGSPALDIPQDLSLKATGEGKPALLYRSERQKYWWIDGTVREYVIVEKAPNLKPDHAQISTIKNVTPGGIDLSEQNTALRVTKDANGGVKVNVDPALIARVEREGLSQVIPVIINIAPADMRSIFKT